MNLVNRVIGSSRQRQVVSSLTGHVIMRESVSTYNEPLPHLCSWQLSLTRCRPPGTVWCWFPGGQSLAGSARHRLHQSGCCIRFGRRSHFLGELGLDSTPLSKGEDKVTYEIVGQKNYNNKIGEEKEWMNHGSSADMTSRFQIYQCITTPTATPTATWSQPGNLLFVLSDLWCTKSICLLLVYLRL